MPRANPRLDRTVDLEGIDRFTLPVRDLAKAELFYTQVLGADIVQREAVEMSERDHPALRVRMCDGVDVVLVQQHFGWQPVDSTNPHWGFAIPGTDLDTWVEHLKEWEVPSAVVFRDDDQEAIGTPTRAELHFLDPDGNQIELVAWDYPMNDRAWRGQYDSWTLLYNYRDWPPSSARNLLAQPTAAKRD
jgi:catechol 2,3-dioxygenase-like lactoylglutathione lyase family enzyme